jgi:hypothetical protein
MIKRKRASRPLVTAALIFLCAAPPAVVAQETGSQISGRILLAGEPLAGAKVLAYHLSTEELFISEPTSAGGQYIIAGLPYGYFDLAVESAEGIFVADQVFNVPPTGKSVLTFNLVPFSAGAPGTADDRRSFPGTEDDPVGVAQVEEKMKGADFWTSKAGIAILAGAGGTILLLLVGGGGDGSPSQP